MNAKNIIADSSANGRDGPTTVANHRSSPSRVSPGQRLRHGRETAIGYSVPLVSSCAWSRWRVRRVLECGCPLPLMPLVKRPRILRESTLASPKRAPGSTLWLSRPASLNSDLFPAFDLASATLLADAGIGNQFRSSARGQRKASQSHFKHHFGKNTLGRPQTDAISPFGVCPCRSRETAKVFSST